jgi:hypothetical protein
MASMRDAQQLTEDLRNRADELHGELTDGEVDFKKITQLADQLGAAADRVATTFQRINDAFDESEDGESGESGKGGQSLTDALSPGAKGQESSDGGEGPSREELYELAKKADIPGRSEMSKNQLERALKRAGAKVS